MGIISQCYYDEGVISKKFQFVLNQILGARHLFRAKSSGCIVAGTEV